MNDTLKAAGRIGAELGAAKAEVERLRGALQAMLDECDPMNLNCGEPWCRARAALLPRSEPCGGCGNDDESKRCIGCGHQFTPVPTDTYTAVDMATAAAQGFRDGQAAVEQGTAQDEQTRFEAWAKTQGDKWLIVGGLQWSAGTDDYASARTNAAWAAWQERAALSARPAQTAHLGKFRMGDLVKKSTGSEWEGRVVGWYSTEQTKEGYAVESSAHRNSVQIYPVTALEAVDD